MVNKHYLENLKADVKIYRIKDSDTALEELLHRIQNLPLEFELDVVSHIIRVRYTYQTANTSSSSLISIASSTNKRHASTDGYVEEEETVQFIIKKINAAMPSLKSKLGIIFITYYHLLLNVPYHKMEELKLYPFSRSQFYEDKKDAIKRIKYAIGLE